MHGEALSWFVFAALAAVAVGCAPPCETGAQCARRCPPSTAAECVAHGLCGCVVGPAPDLGLLEPSGGEVTSGGGAAGGSAGQPGIGGTGGGADAPRVDCSPPEIGALVINEIVLDGEPTEDEEFVELVSLVDVSLDLAGVQITSNRGAEQVRRVEFIAGCLPAGGAVAIFPDVARWRWSPTPEPMVEVESRAFGFANGGAFDFRLLDREGGVLDRFAGDGEASRPGVSINRAPDRAGSALVAHDDPVLGALGPSSPARCANGAEHADGCIASAEESPERDGSTPDGSTPPGPDAAVALDHGGAPGSVEGPQCQRPAPGELVIAEVLVDGERPRLELDEFVELVSRSPHPIDLTGVSLSVASGGGAATVRVALASGCLAPFGALVLRPRVDDWGWHPAPNRPAEASIARLALGNEAQLRLTLTDASGQVLDDLDLAGRPIVEGVSLRRRPEPDGAELVLHDILDPDSRQSPGRCTDGSPFDAMPCVEPAPEADCRPVDQFELMVNEVLVDGVEPEDRDEFIEVLSLVDGPRDLSGLEIWSTSGDGTLAPRLTLPAVCLDGGAAVAIRGDTDGWVWSAPPARPVPRVDGRLGLVNGLDTQIRLLQADRDPPALIAEVAVSRQLVRVGVSATRAVDGDPESALVAHDTVGGRSSPGLRADGRGFDEIGPHGPDGEPDLAGPDGGHPPGAVARDRPDAGADDPPDAALIDVVDMADHEAPGAPADGGGR